MRLGRLERLGKETGRLDRKTRRLWRLWREAGKLGMEARRLRRIGKVVGRVREGNKEGGRRCIYHFAVFTLVLWSISSSYTINPDAQGEDTSLTEPWAENET